MTRRRTVTITRTIDIDVTVGHHPGVAQSWWEPGEPEQTWIEEAIDHDGNPVELTDCEATEAARKALEPAEDPDPVDPESDNDKPF